MSSVCRSWKPEEDVDLDKQLDMERCLDGNECMWLSSDCASPSSFFAKHKLSGSFDLYGEDWFSWLSNLADSYPHLVPEKTIPDAEETLQEGVEELYADDWLISWPSTLTDSYPHLGPEKTIPDAEETLQKSSEELSLHGNNAIDPSMTSSENSRFSSEEHFEDSLTPSRINLDSSSQISDMGRTSFCFPLMNLDGEDFQWISDTEFELDNFQSGFPSPSYRSSCNSEVKSPISSASTPTEARDKKANYELSPEIKPASEASNLEDFSVDEPLFWPFEHDQQCWSSGEAWNCFTMSPRKDLAMVRNPEGTSLRATQLQSHGRKMHPKDGCGRRIVLKSGLTASKILELKQRNNNNKQQGVKKINTMPSRLRKSKKLSIKVVPLEMEEDFMESSDGKVPILEPFPMDRNLFQDDFPLNDEELPIETVLGLHEFDGHEGVDSDLSEDIFILENYL